MRNLPWHLFRTAALVAAGWLLSCATTGAETWADALRGMPLGSTARVLNRTNCVEVMLKAFRSNATVRALVFMPGATDEFYMFRRAQAVLTQGSASLLDAVQALTNQTLLRASFRPPVLLLYTAEDALNAQAQITDQPTADRLKGAATVGHLLCNDWDWDLLQPQLRSVLGVDLRPWKGSTASWHFYRHSFAGWGLSGWEALKCAAWAGKSRFNVYRKRVVFEPDPRVQTSVRFETDRRSGSK